MGSRVLTKKVFSTFFCFYDHRVTYSFLGSMIAFVSEARILVVVLSLPNMGVRYMPAETLGDRVERVCQIRGHNYGWLMLCKEKTSHYWRLAIVSEDNRQILETF